MPKKLTENQWGFDIKTDNPFMIFRYLREIAIEKVGIQNVLDLSRGDPGNGFAPNVRSRRFYAFLLMLDTEFNNLERHFVDDKNDYVNLRQEIETFAFLNYADTEAEKLLNDFDFFIQYVVEISYAQGLNWSEKDVLFQMFTYSGVSGGYYHNPQGETITRLIVADYYQKQLKTEIDYQDLIFTNGVSHAIGTLFKTLGEEGLGYLKKGDTVLAPSPAYAPYNMIMQHRGINVLPIGIDPITGEVEPGTKAKLDAFEGEVKMVVLIDPNNPTGFISTEELVDLLVEFAEKKNSLIVTDEVYSSFFETKVMIFDKAPKRTIRLDARSKIERATGLRFGDFLITKEGNAYISNNILSGYLSSNLDLKTQLIYAKGPGGIKGEFQHVTFVPGPSQYLGVCHMVLGAEERKQYIEIVRDNCKIFQEKLGLPYLGNYYYATFNLEDLEGFNRYGVPAEENMLSLAEKGLIYIPANLFFSKEDRAKQNRENFVRACLPNLTYEATIKAAEITKEYVGS